MEARGGPVEYGFVSQQVVYDLQDIGNWKVRADAIETLQGLVAHLKDSSVVMPRLSEFVRFLVSLLSDPNFKISLTTTQIFGDLVGKIGKGFQPYIGSIMPSLVEKLGDNKIVVRQANIKVLSKLTQTLEPSDVLGALIGAMGHKNWRVREEIVNLIIQALLSCEPSRLDHIGLCRALVEAVGDTKDKVRAVALEGLAVVAGTLGAVRVQQVVGDMGSPSDVQRLVSERLSSASPALPIINAEGLVEHPLLNGSRPGTTASQVGMGGRAAMSDYSISDSLMSDGHSGELPSPKEDGGGGGSGLSGRRGGATPQHGAGRERKPIAMGQIPWDVPAPRARTVHGRARPPSSEPPAHPDPSSHISLFPPPGQHHPHGDAGAVAPLLKRRQDRSPPRVDVGMSNVSPEKRDPTSTRSDVYPVHQQLGSSGDLDFLAGPPSAPNHQAHAHGGGYSYGYGGAGAGSESSASTARGGGGAGGAGLAGEWNGMTPTSTPGSSVSPVRGPPSGRSRPAASTGSMGAGAGGGMPPRGDILSPDTPGRNGIGPGAAYPVGAVASAGRGGYPGAPSLRVHSHQEYRSQTPRLEEESEDESDEDEDEDGSEDESEEDGEGASAEEASSSSAASSEGSARGHGAPGGAGGLGAAAGGGEEPAVTGVNLWLPSSHIKPAPREIAGLGAMDDPHRGGYDERQALAERSNAGSAAAAAYQHQHQPTMDHQLEGLTGRRSRRAAPGAPSGGPGSREDMSLVGAGRNGGSNFPPPRARESTDGPDGTRIRAQTDRTPERPVGGAARAAPRSSVGAIARPETTTGLFGARGDDDVSPEARGGGAGMTQSLSTYKGKLSILNKRRQELRRAHSANTVDVGRSGGVRKEDEGEEPPSPRGIEAAMRETFGRDLDDVMGVGGVGVGGQESPGRGYRATGAMGGAGRRGPGAGGGGPPAIVPPTYAGGYDQHPPSPGLSPGAGYGGSRPARGGGWGSGANDGPTTPSGSSAPTSAGRGRGSVGSRLQESSAHPLEEVTTTELQACANPEQLVTRVLACLAVANQARAKELDWQAQYEGLVAARRLAVHHGDVLSHRLHDLILAVLPAVDALRSQISRTALQLLKELFAYAGRAMDSELDFVVPVLIKKSAEGNFLSDEADLVISEMLGSVTEARATMALLACANHKAAVARTKVAAHLEGAVYRAGGGGARLFQGPGGRDLLERLFTTMVAFLDEGSVETRTFAKRVLYELHRVHQGGEVERMVRKLPNEAKGKQVRVVIDNPKGPPEVPGRPRKIPPSRQNSSGGVGVSRSVRSSSWSAERNGAGAGAGSSAETVSSGSGGAGGGSGGGGRAGTRTAPGAPRPRGAPAGGGAPGGPGGRKPSAGRTDSGVPGSSGGGPSEADLAMLEAELTPLLHTVGSKDWRERSEALKSLERVVIRHKDSLGEARLMQVSDHIVARLSDGNSKVSVQALQTLSGILPELEDAAAVTLNTLVPALAGNLGSTNEKIRRPAEEAVDALISSMDNALLLQNFAHCVSHGNVRGKALMVEKLTAVVADVYPRRPPLVVRHALPAAFAMLNETKDTQVRAANQRLLGMLSRLMGADALREHAGNISEANQARLRDILGAQRR